MKRLIVLAAAALMAFPAMAQMQEAYPSYIQVNGRAEKEITPDEFYLQVVINERDSKGRISVESQQRDMIAALRKLGVIIILVLLGLLAYKHQLFDGKLLENIPTIESNEEKPEILTSPQHGGALEIPMI